MNKLITLTILLFTLIGCKSKTEKGTEEATAENEDYYDCTSFFNTGDYRAFCTVDTEIVAVLNPTIDGGGTVCKYIIPRLNSKTHVDTGVYFMSLPTTELTKDFFEKRKITSEKAAADNPKKFHSEILIGGYEGYISEGQFANYGKSISVRYKNVLVTTEAVYYKDWFPMAPPCNYETNELKELMRVVLENM